MVDKAARRALDKVKQESTGQLLLKCARLLDEVAIRRINRQAGAPLVRPVHTRLFPHIDFEGTRIVDLAGKLGVTKQAVSQWVGELADMQVVELIPDPDDGRAKRVRFTARGLAAIHHGLGVLKQIEDQLSDRVGTRKMAALKQALDALTPALEALATAEGDSR
jgi:DNA-binding MarR family transcriptional regulator